MFLHTSRGNVLARLDLASVKPLFGGEKSRDGRPISKQTRKVHDQIVGQVPMMKSHADLQKSFFSSGASGKKRLPGALLSEFNQSDSFEDDLANQRAPYKPTNSFNSLNKYRSAVTKQNHSITTAYRNSKFNNLVTASNLIFEGSCNQ